MAKNQTQQDRAAKKRKSHHPTIRETEATLSEMSPEEARLLEELAAHCDPIPPEERVWIGGRQCDDPDLSKKIMGWAGGDTTYYSALQLIVLAIVRAHPTAQTAARTAKNSTEQRIKAATSALIGQPAKKGQVHRADAERICTAAAYQYARLVDHPKEDSETQHVYPLFKKLLAPRLVGKTPKQQDDIIRPYLNYFAEHKQRLLVKVTWYTDDEQKFRRAHLARILLSLKALGISVDCKAVIEQVTVPKGKP